MIAALFVETGGTYFGLPNVDPWDVTRDARKYAGPHPVVAHPPCSRWCRLAGLVEARWHGKTVGKGKRRRVVNAKRGDDGGCFAAALNAVRTWGGVLEHPAYSDAFGAFGIAPPRPGGWQRAICGGWVAHVEQWHYGHPAKKATWLYAFGASHLPSLVWETTADNLQLTGLAQVGGFKTNGKDKRALVSWCGNKTKSGEKRRRLRSNQASATPLPFRDLLISIAESAREARRDVTLL